MTEGEGEPTTRSDPATVAVELGGFGDNTFQGPQSFSLERGEHELKVKTTEHEQAMQAAEHKQMLADRGKDNALRRWCFGGVLVVLLAALIFSGLVGIVNTDPTTRQWGQGLVSTLLGGLVGAIAGYFTAKAGG